MSPEVRDERLHHLTGPDPDIVKIAGDFAFTEGPAWRRDRSELIFSNSPGNRMHRWSRGKSVSVDRDPSNKASITWNPAGRLITREHVTSRVVRPNGRMPFYGVERPRRLDVQSVNRGSPAGKDIVMVVDDFDEPNDLCFSHDKRLLRTNDTARRDMRFSARRGIRRQFRLWRGRSPHIVHCCQHVSLRDQASGRGSPDGLVAPIGG